MLGYNLEQCFRAVTEILQHTCICYCSSTYNPVGCFTNSMIWLTSKMMRPTECFIICDQPNNIDWAMIVIEHYTSSVCTYMFNDCNLYHLGLSKLINYLRVYFLPRCAMQENLSGPDTNKIGYIDIYLQVTWRRVPLNHLPLFYLFVSILYIILSIMVRNGVLSLEVILYEQEAVSNHKSHI